MIYGSVCSGIEAATVAWEPLGWKPAFFSEIDAFPRAVLTHHYPGVPLHGDFRTVESGDYPAIDVLVGGTPCQDFSVAGLRTGIAGDRGALSIEFLRCAQRLRPRWVVWENVPGLLQADGGEAFEIFLGQMAECGFGFAYRVLDAQYFGVPQRRRRVFVIGHTDWRRAAAVLFERESLSGDSPSCRESRTVTPTLSSSGAGVSRVKGARRSDDVEWIDAVYTASVDLQQVTSKYNGSVPSDITPTLNERCDRLIAFSSKDDGGDANELAPTLRSMNETQSNQNGGGQVAVASRSGVRRLTPIECERLQGFPDDYTLVPDPRRRGKLAADQPRYHVLGNSMAVPVMHWIGERIDFVESL